MNLYPSILTDLLQTAQAQLDLVKDIKGLEVVQIDIVDGQFADNLTIFPLDLIDLDFGNLQIDLHLMTEEPMGFVQEALTLKDQLPIRAIISQIERMSYPAEYIQEVKKNGWQVGLSLDLHTPTSALENYLAELDIVQLMAIEAGAQGQEFQSKALKKLEILNPKFETNPKAQSLNPKNLEIIVDGGVKLKHLNQLKKAGVDSVCVGSGIWQADDPHIAIEIFLS